MTIDNSMEDPRQLLQALAETWSTLEIPHLPDNLRTNFELAPYFKHIQGKSWEEVDLTHRELSAECWLDLLPDAPTQVFYFGSFLRYCLTFFLEQAEKECEFPDADMPFLCTIAAARKIGRFAESLPNNLRNCVTRILQFIRDHLGSFGYELRASQQIYPQPTPAERLDEAISLWRHASATEGKRQK